MLLLSSLIRGSLRLRALRVVRRAVLRSIGGLLAAAGDSFRRRFGLCCSRRGCRRSVLPPSVRFLGQGVYLEAAILLACLQALIGGVPSDDTPVAGVSKKTVVRWLSWWTSTFPSSPTWLWIRGRLMRPVDETQLPRSFLERVAQNLGDTPEVARVLAIVPRWLAPLTTPSMSNPSRFLAKD